MYPYYQLLLKLKTAKLEELQNELKLSKRIQSLDIEQLTSQKIKEDLEKYRQNRIKELEAANAEQEQH